MIGKGIAGDVIDRLAQWDWPGNIRELENLIERLMVLGTVQGDQAVVLEDIAPELRAVVAEPAMPALRDQQERSEQEHLAKVLEECGGNRALAAQQLGISQPTVTSHLRQLETRYGVELFYRQGKGVYLSQQGERLLPQVEQLMQQAAQMQAWPCASGGTRAPSCRAGATSGGAMETEKYSRLLLIVNIPQITHDGRCNRGFLGIQRPFDCQQK